MGKLIASINMTLDGFCDHTQVIADDDLHENANELLRNTRCYFIWPGYLPTS